MQNGKRGAYAIASTGDPSIGGGWNNQQLLKDCGLVPYLLQKNHGFHSVMVGMKVDANYPYKKYVGDLELDFLPEDSVQARINYVDAHADDIDLLILYGAYPIYIPLVEHYKKIRPDGKIYLATDINIAWADRLPHEHPAYKKFLQSCDVVGASCRAAQKYIAAKWSVPVDLLRNGWYNFFGVKLNIVFSRKENVILTVGRIGSNQKQNHILLEAFAKVADDLPGWSVRLVGNIDDNFKPYIEKFFAAHPNLRERVIFTGLIEDKIALMEEYKRAKIFCLTSNFEGGTPNVVAEALFNGDFAICSSFDAAGDMIDDGNCGRSFPIGDVDALANILREVCPDKKILLDGGRHAAAYAQDQFDANKIVARLNYLLYGGDES